jgi:N-acetylglucosaminyldiphosphoundecaprenol N-acetyl-beta-D-mannosaminyltransferase
MLPTETTGHSPQANVLGVGISAVNMHEAVLRSMQLLERGGKGYICVTGVHGIMEAQRDPALRVIHNRAHLCVPDGMPTVWVGRLQGHRTMRRVYGPDFMWEMCRQSVARGYRHFLYGGKPGVTERLRLRLEQQLPGLCICGAYTPPFRELTAQEEDDLVTAVDLAKPHVVWVGVSTPRQERFMARMLDRLNTNLMVGVGAAFDIHAGLLADAPPWMKSCGLQWLHRLAMEPRRLAKRYLINNPGFLWNIALQLTKTKTFMVDTAVLDRR